MQLAKHPDVQVFVVRPPCEKQGNNITSEEVTEKANGKIELPEDTQIDFVIGLGKYHGHEAKSMARELRCKLIQFVYSDPEAQAVFRSYEHPGHLEEVDLCSMADCVVVVGPELAEVFRRYLREKDRKVYAFTPGILCEFSDEPQGKYYDNQGSILAFCDVDDKEFIMTVVQEVLTKLNDARVILVGAHNNQHKKIESVFSGLTFASDKLRFMNSVEFRKCLKQHFSQVDLAIMLSRNENFGFIGLEAMSAGLPVILSANSGLGKALAKVTFGSTCVVSTENAVDWAKTIEKVWNKGRELRLEESKALCKNYARKCSWEKQCNDLVEMMKDILNGRNFQF